MIRKTLIALSTLLAVLACASFAQAAQPKKPHCKTGYVAKIIRVKEHRHGKVVYVRVWRCERKRAATTVTTAPPKITYTTKVDPSFTQASDNPLQVTYSISAGADATTSTGVTTDLATVGQLPSGVLDFYSQGSLVCSINVGGATDGGPCTVTYPTTGTYTVVTEYIPTGASAVTQTEVETIAPFATHTVIATSIGDYQASCDCYAVGIDGAPLDPSGNIVPFGTLDPVTGDKNTLEYTITDTTTGQVMGHVAQPINEACALIFAFRTGTSGGEFLHGSCPLVWGTYPTPGGLGFYVPQATDDFEITATYAGGTGYSASTSDPWPA